MGWAASPSRKSEQLFSLPLIQMGARVYIPSLGRFLQVDPIEGGTLNAYVYAHDPVNMEDYSGKFLAIPFILIGIAAVGLTGAYVATTPAYRSAASTIAGNVRRNTQSAVSTIQSLARSQAPARAEPKIEAVPQLPMKRGYTPTTSGRPVVRTETITNLKQQAAVANLQAELHAGIKPNSLPLPLYGPGGSINGMLGNSSMHLMWKYQWKDPMTGVTLHYTIDEFQLTYEDIKVK